MPVPKVVESGRSNQKNGTNPTFGLIGKNALDQHILQIKKFELYK